MDSIAAIYASDGAARRAKAKASGVGERRRGDRMSEGARQSWRDQPVQDPMQAQRARWYRSSRCWAARPACGRSRRPPAIDGAGNRGVGLPGRYDRQGDHRARATAARLSGGSTPLQSRSTAVAKIKHRGKQNAQAALHRGSVDLVTEDGSGNTVVIENWLEKSREARRHGIDLHRRRESLLPCGHVPSPRFSLLPDSLSFE